MLGAQLLFIDHLNSLKNDYINKGYSENKSIKLAIKDFGDQKNISDEFNFETYSYNKKVKNFLLPVLLYIL